MAEIVLNSDNFDIEVIESDMPVLVDFWATWCGPCKMLSPVIEQIAQEYSDNIKVCKLNIDDFPKTADMYHVEAIPTLILFKNGAIVDMLVGFHPKEYIEKFIAQGI